MASAITLIKLIITPFILLHEEFLQFDWLRTMVFQLNLKLLPTCENYKTFTGSEKQIIAWFVRDIWHKILYS